MTYLVVLVCFWNLEIMTCLVVVVMLLKARSYKPPNSSRQRWVSNARVTECVLWRSAEFCGILAGTVLLLSRAWILRAVCVYCYWHFRFKSWYGQAIQVQTLNGLMETNSFDCKWPNREHSSRCEGPLRHSKLEPGQNIHQLSSCWGFTARCSEWNPRLWHYWGRNSFGRKCQ